MAADDIARFRRLCGQFRWLAVFMVLSVTAVLVLMYVVAPSVALARGVFPGDVTPIDLVEKLIWATPTLFYLYAVWSIGSAPRSSDASSVRKAALRRPRN